jgi:carboxyl-terminal processing protease
MKLKTLLSPLLLALFLIGGVILGYNAGTENERANALKNPPQQILNASSNLPSNVTTTPQELINANSTSTVDFSLFWETWRQLEKNYLHKDRIDYQKMVYGAISGMVNSIGDPYTNFFTPAQAKDFNEELSGRYEGIGMVIGSMDVKFVAISQFKYSPAEKAGLKAGDSILKIGDRYTLNLPVDEAARLIRGSSGTEVVLLVERSGWTEPKEFKIKRQVIKIPTLEMEIKEGSIAVIKIYQFNEILTSEFEKAVKANPNFKKIVVDVRNNPGGYLEVAQSIAGWFVEKGQVVVWQDKGDGNPLAYRSPGPAKFKSYPTVVLINEGSASASEILAGALRDQNNTKLVGVKSFGKGSVQEQIGLSQNGSLKVTIARWLTPKNYSIDEKGLEPDVKVESSDKEAAQDNTNDPVMEKAIELLKSQ